MYKRQVTAKASQRLDEEARFTSEVILSYQTGTISNDAELEAKIVAKKIQDMIGHLELDNFNGTKRPVSYTHLFLHNRKSSEIITI